MAHPSCFHACRLCHSVHHKYRTEKNRLTLGAAEGMHDPMRQGSGCRLWQGGSGEPGFRHNAEQRVQINIVALVSPKGGTGKSSLATAIAASAAGEGCALLCNLDPQGSCYRWWHVHRARSRASSPELDLSVRRVSPGGILEQLRADSASCPGWVVCDLAGGAFGPLVEVLKLSDLVLVPLRPSVPDPATITRLKGFTDALPRGEGAGRMAVVLSQAAGRLAFSRSALQEQAGVSCCRTHISQSLAWPDACEQGLAVKECRPVRYRQAANQMRELWTGIRDMIRQRGDRP